MKRRAPSIRVLRLVVLFASLPLALLTAYITGSKWAALAVFALIVLAVSTRLILRDER